MGTINKIEETTFYGENVVAVETMYQTRETGNHGATRIEDYATVKACHQCRQIGYVYGSCGTQKQISTCPNKLCPRCLKNRYGEIVEEVVANNHWFCPKCRGICNCSYCRKKSGKNATGILVGIAKASGYNNVSEFLQNSKDADKYVYMSKAETVRAKRKREVRKMLKAAKDKKKKLEKKIENELARGETENNGISLSVDQKLEILRKMDAETEEVFAELHDALEMRQGLRYDCDDHEQEPEIEEFIIASKKMKKASSIKEDNMDIIDHESAMDTTDPELAVDTTDLELEADTIDPKSVMDIIDLESAADTIDPELAMDTIDPETAVDTTDPELAAYTIDPKSVMDSTDPELAMDTIDPETAIDTTDPELAADTIDPKSVMDSTDPELTMDTIDPEKAVDTTDPELAAHTIDPKSVMDCIDPELAAYIIDLELALDTIDPESTMDINDPKLAAYTIDFESAIYSIDP